MELDEPPCHNFNLSPTYSKFRAFLEPYYVMGVSSDGAKRVKYGVITNYVNDYINLLVRIAHIICNYPLFCLRLTA
jgi:hypothetical protein